MAELERLAVFIDYQNAYMGARQALGAGPDDPHMVGQFDPLKLARLIAQRHPSYEGAKLRQLELVSIYRGLPGWDCPNFCVTGRDGVHRMWSAIRSP